MNIINGGWNWLTARAAWNVHKEVSQAERELRDKPPPTLAQKIRIGLWDGLSGMPKKILITGIATAAIGYFLPVTFSPQCLELARNTVPSSVSNVVLKTLWGVVAEEAVFRVGLQNLLQRLEDASSPILASLGSLKNRTIISSILFAANHLNYYVFGNECSAVQGNIVQVTRNVFDANYTALYENYGIAAAFSSHLANNMLAIAPALFVRAILGL